MLQATPQTPDFLPSSSFYFLYGVRYPICNASFRILDIAHIKIKYTGELCASIAIHS